MRVTQLELDLDVFAGPFDLLLSLILREELDLLEVDLAEIVITYLDHLESTDQLDLESATEFLVLIAALLELKSRLMLPNEEVEELDELAPAEAAEELIERMLQYARFRAAGAHLARLHEHERGFLYRSAPAKLGPAEVTAGAYEPSVLGAALGSLLRLPRPIDLSHMAMPRVTVAERLTHLRGLLKRAASFSFDEAVKDADRVTVCVTVFALLELYKRGEASWEQDEPFGEITVHPTGATPIAAGEALLFLAPDPATVEELADALQTSEEAVTAAAASLDAALADRGLVLKRIGGGLALASHPDAEEAARRLLARPRTPALTPAQAETLAIVAYLQPVSRPEVARIRGVASESATTALVDRGLIEEAGRSQFGAVLYRTTAQFLKLFGLESPEALPDIAQWDPSPEEAAQLRDRLLRAGEARSGTSG